MSNRWIRVEDQRPPKDEPVVYRRSLGGGRYGVGIAYWSKSDTWVPEMQSQFAPGFTEWLPLPAPDTVGNDVPVRWQEVIELQRKEIQTLKAKISILEQNLIAAAKPSITKM